MSNPKSKESIIKHKNKALSTIGNYMDSLIESSDNKTVLKADKLSYWIEDWTRFLLYENTFDSTRLRRYKRGEVIKVHLGFNVGSEEGGLHYAVVLDKQNSVHDSTVRIVPLTSVKEHTDINNLHPSEIFIGNELFTTLRAKTSQRIRQLNIDLDNIKDQLKQDLSDENRKSLNEKLKKISKQIEQCNKMTTEIQRMKKGSIVLTGQITTISKIRIYDPRTNYDALSNVKLSNESLDRIDDAIIKNITNL